MKRDARNIAPDVRDMAADVRRMAFDAPYMLLMYGTWRLMCGSQGPEHGTQRAGIATRARTALRRLLGGADPRWSLACRCTRPDVVNAHEREDEYDGDDDDQSHGPMLLDPRLVRPAKATEWRRTDPDASE